MKTITINNPNGEARTVAITPALEKHWAQPINHCDTILNQINGGMYDKWFAGKSDLTVLDFGANVGLTGLYFFPHCKYLIMVEPTPSHASILGEMFTKINPLPHVWFLHEHALAEKEKEVVFMTGHSTENKITSPEGYGNGKVTIQAYPLSWFVGTNEIDFCKVDIEGYEIHALSQDEINKVAGQVKVFFVEMHPYENWGFENMPQELTKRFETAGYSVEQLDFQTIVATWQ